MGSKHEEGKVDKGFTHNQEVTFNFRSSDKGKLFSSNRVSLNIYIPHFRREQTREQECKVEWVVRWGGSGKRCG